MFATSKNSFICYKLSIVLLLGAFTACKRDEKAFVFNTTMAVNPATLVAEASAPDAPRTTHFGHPLDLKAIPKSFAAFKPIEIIYNAPGSYFIVTARHLQRRTGLYIAPNDVTVPDGAKNLILSPIAPRLYFYQD